MKALHRVKDLFTISFSEIGHRHLQFSCPLRDDSTGAAVAPGAPKKAARPVDVNRLLDDDHLKTNSF